MAEIELPEVEDLEEKKHHTFTRRVALITAVYAVFLAITSLGGSNAMKEMLLAQQEASNQWAFYQAKVLREHLYRSQKMVAELQLVVLGEKAPAETKAKVQAYLDKMAAEEKRYGEEKRIIEADAKKFENERDVNRDKDPYFDYAEVLLQISIVMSSVAILSSSRQVFFISLAFAVLGVILSINGFTLLVRIPLFHS